MRKWVCSRCGKDFYRPNEFSSLGYRQCIKCDFDMFFAMGLNLPWPEKDNRVPSEDLDEPHVVRAK